MRSMSTIVLCAVLTALAAPSTHAALTTTHYGTDAEMLAILTNVAFVAEGRGGDGAGAATFELDLGPDTSVPAVTKQYGWVSGQVEPFTLTYDSGLNEVTFTLGGEVLKFTPLPGFTDIFIRARAVNANSTIVVNNLVLDAENVADQSSADGNASGLDILRIEGGTLNDGFVMTGDATLTWQGSMPTQSRLAFQVKVGTPDSGTPVHSSTWGRVKSLYR